MEFLVFNMLADFFFNALPKSALIMRVNQSKITCNLHTVCIGVSLVCDT